jgi:valyl-tRNA synthetase
LHSAAQLVSEELQTYRFDEAASTIYQFFWGSFCDWYLEIAKLRLNFEADKEGSRAALTTLLQVFEASLRLLSPFMPFLTEEIWHAVYEGALPAKSIALTPYPKSGYGAHKDRDIHAQAEMQLLQELISVLRATRKDAGVEEKAAIPVEVRIAAANRALVEANAAIVERLARVSEIRFVEEISAGLPKSSTSTFDVAIVYERTIDVPAERERLTRDIAKYEKGLAAAERQLGNESFLAKAPEQVVEGLKKQESETRVLLEKARAALDALPGI